MTIGSLFAGIGGLELGLERAGLGPVLWQVELDPFCRAVLAQHWPEAKRYEDVRSVGAHNLEHVDLVCGGFPCQDLSFAGRGAGLAGERSGLWREYLRIVREVRPRYVVVENVAALLARGLGVVLGDLASSGYDAVWDCIPAAALGAPHYRDRLFIVAIRRDVAHAAEAGRQAQPRQLEKGRATAFAALRRPTGADRWSDAPRSLRVDDGVSVRLDRTAALGNAVVPQVAELIGLAIVEVERGRA